MFVDSLPSYSRTTDLRKVEEFFGREVGGKFDGAPSVPLATALGASRTAIEAPKTLHAVSCLSGTPPLTGPPTE